MDTNPIQEDGINMMPSPGPMHRGGDSRWRTAALIAGGALALVVGVMVGQATASTPKHSGGGEAFGIGALGGRVSTQQSIAALSRILHPEQFSGETIAKAVGEPEDIPDWSKKLFTARCAEAGGILLLSDPVQCSVDLPALPAVPAHR